MDYQYRYMEFEQPAGIFLLTIVPAKDLLNFYFIDRRRYIGRNPSGTQRDEASKRIVEISKYVTNLDATFPTAIIIALPKGNYSLDHEKHLLTVTGEAEIIDGQHRIEGLKEATSTYGQEVIEKFNLPCVFVVEPYAEEKAFIFATINGKQNKVNASLVYDLFGVSSTPDPYNILHKLARTLNFKSDSPFHERLKMLGKKSNDKVTESLSQGTFIDTLMPKISKEPDTDRNLMKQDKYSDLSIDPKLVLRDYLLNKKGDLLIPLFENIFNAVKKVWPEEWENHNKFILSKTTGYIGIMKGIDDLIIYGKQVGVLSEAFFEYFFIKVRDKIQEENLQLIKEDFPPGGVGENKVREFLRRSYNDNYPLTEAVLSDIKSKSS